MNDEKEMELKKMDSELKYNFKIEGEYSMQSIDIVSKHFDLIDQTFYAFERGDLKWLLNHGQRVYPYILESLGIDLSKINDDDDDEHTRIGKHKSGLYSKQFILFSLHELEYENRDSGLIKKSLLPPSNVERFVNYLSPNASKNNGSKIDFKNSLSNINVKCVGIFGNKEKICNILFKLKMADDDMYVLSFLFVCLFCCNFLFCSCAVVLPSDSVDCFCDFFLF